MSLDDTRHLFILESRELLESMEEALLALTRAEDASEPVNAIFRAAHTIKGSAGLFGLDRIVAFTHVVESVLDEVRAGRLVTDSAMIGLLLACGDHIGALVDALEQGSLDSDDALHASGAPLVAQLQTCLGHELPAAPGSARPATQTSVKEAGSVANAGSRAGRDAWHISLRFGRDVLRHGMDPLSFIHYLKTIGTVVAIETVPDALPGLAEMDAESCYLGFEIELQTTADKQAIESVFEFVQDDCLVRILPPNSRVAEYIQLIETLPEQTPRLGEILVRCGTLTARELEEALNIQTAAEAGLQAGTAIGGILVEQGVVQPEVVEAALVKQQSMREAKTQETRSIRVDADKLDRLINLVGELIIAAASTDLEARRARVPVLQERTSTLTGLVESVRDSALQLRMVKIGATFSRFQRVVHDVSQEIGKDIALELQGEDTELDKTIVERIADPLTHLVRNAMDHGIETAEIRAAQGKPARGRVGLNAFHESGSIVIEVSDDGGGLKRDRILAKAIERGLVDAGAVLSDNEIYNLIFEPGFSTAEQVTNLSGRGVGMDVVKRNITALRGSVDVRSQEGVGTTVSIRLPLTLAIIDGFLVSLGDSIFVVPLDTIDECIDMSAESGQDYTNLRGTVLPFLRLREHFGMDGTSTTRQNIVIVKHAGQRMGLVVDALLGEFQTVIKPLGRMFSHIKCISGSTILGSGEVALILDVAALFHQAGNTAARTSEPRETALAA